MVFVSCRGVMYVLDGLAKNDRHHCHDKTLITERCLNEKTGHRPSFSSTVR
ncbi:hypothetical protein ALT721_2150024 [Alteromonas alvinellae]